MTKKQKLLKKITLGELPVFYSNPIFEDEKEDSYVLKVKEIKIKAYATNDTLVEDYKILKPMCKSFKL